MAERKTVNPISRTAAHDPFQGAPAKRFKGISRTEQGPNRAQFQVGQVDNMADTVQGLVKFAGVGADIITQQLNKQVAEDSIIQTQRALMGQGLSDEATAGGRKAHAAIVANNAAMKAEKQLETLAAKGLSEDEQEEAIRQVYREVDEAMVAKYPEYASTPELQKLTALAMAEKLPKIADDFEVGRIEREQESRVAAMEDSLLLDVERGVPTELAIERFTAQADAMQLSQSERDDVISKLISNSDNNALIDFAKNYKGERSVTLYDRDQSIRTKETTNNSRLATQMSVEMGVEKDALDELYVSGQISKQRFLGEYKRLNKKYGNKFASASDVEVILEQGRKEAVKRHKHLHLMQSFSKGEITNDPRYKKKDIETGLTSYYAQQIDTARKEILGSDRSEAEKQQALSAAQKQITARSFDLSARQGVEMSWAMSSLSAFANADINSSTEPLANGKLRLNDSMQAAMTLARDMSDNARSFYFDKLTKREATVLRGTLGLIDRGVPEVQAYQRAVQIANDPPAVRAKAIRTATDSIMSELDQFFGGHNDKSLAHAQRLISQDLQWSVDPENEYQQKEIIAKYQRQYTDIGDGTYVRGTSQSLTKMTGAKAEQLGTLFKAAAWANRAAIEPNLPEGMTLDELYPVVDPDSSTVYFETPDGIPASTAIPLSKLRDSTVQYQQFVAKEAARRKLAHYENATGTIGEELDADEVWSEHDWSLNQQGLLQEFPEGSVGWKWVKEQLDRRKAR